MSVMPLVRNEVLKTRKRTATLVTLLALAAMTTLMMLEGHFRSLRTNPTPFELPSAWWRIIGDGGQLASFVGAVLLVLLIASEFSWRTARQNVIDGLSKEQFFLGKLLLLPLLGATLLLVPLVIGPIIAMLGEGLPTGAWMTMSQLKLLGGVALGMMGIGSLVLLIATTVRGTGSAVGVFFLYLAFVERLVGMLIQLLRDEWAVARMYLPFQIFTSLMEPGRWNSAFRPPAAGPPVPEDATVLVAFGAGWIVCFAGAAYWLFMRRDL